MKFYFAFCHEQNKFLMRVLGRIPAQNQSKTNSKPIQDAHPQNQSNSNPAWGPKDQSRTNPKGSDPIQIQSNTNGQKRNQYTPNPKAGFAEEIAVISKPQPISITDFLAEISSCENEENEKPIEKKKIRQ